MTFRSLFAVAAMFVSVGAIAHDYRAGDIYISHPYARASVPGQTSGGAYLTLENKSTSADTLLSAETPAAGSVEIHTMSMQDNVMRMREVDGIDLPAGTIVTMQPGKGFHLMLMNLKAPLKVGDKVPLTLHFKKAGKLETSLWVEDNRAIGNNSSAPVAKPAPKEIHH